MSGGGYAPVMVLNQNTKRESGRKAQEGNIQAAKAVADIIRTCLGPRSMLKMLLDPMGGITMTNDGNAILREIDVAHPAAKSMIELSRAQDENVGDGTTSVIILAGEMLSVAEPMISRSIHPTVIVQAYHRALEQAQQIINTVAKPVKLEDDEQMLKIIKSTLGTKFARRWSDLMCKLALEAVRCVTVTRDDGEKEIDIKQYAKVEKIPGGEIEDCRVLKGVMFNKDITHAKMRRRIENPRILLLDCPLEYKKGESQTNLELSQAADFDTILKLEEQWISKVCKEIIALKPDLVVTEKGLSDLAQHYFVKANITALRRLRKTDNNRIARATGAKIVNRTDEIKESDLGSAGLFEIRKIGDEYFTFIVDCPNPKACTVLLRGGSKDVLNEIDRNLADAMNVARNIVSDPRLVPGGGAIEMAIATGLSEHAKSVTGIAQYPFRAVAEAFEVIPRTLTQNCGANPVRVLTKLRAMHSQGNTTYGINGETGDVVDMTEYDVWEPVLVKLQTIKTAVEAAGMLLRIDDIVSGMKKASGGGAAQQPHPDQPMQEAVGV